MRILRLTVALASLALAGGCASITKGTSDILQVEVSNCGESIDCTATNKRGSWQFSAPGSVKFKKSDNALSIRCQDGDSVITRTVMPTRGGMIWGNVLVGGIIGGAVDAGTDAHWDTVDSISIHRQTCHGKKIEQ